MAQSANGIKGILINCMGEVVFRVYNPDYTFMDYDILHSDVSIIINDEDAFFYHRDGKDYLDHSPETLGIDEKD